MINTEDGEAFRLNYTVCDLGKQLSSGEWQTCEIMAEAAAGRMALGADSVRDGKTLGARNAEVTLKDVPVVFKYYTLTHACAAVCDSAAWHGQVTEPSENWDNVDGDAWEGMRMHASLAMVPELQRTVAVDSYAAKTIDEVVLQQHQNFPGFVMKMDVTGQDGGHHDGMRSDVCGVIPSTGDGPVSLQSQHNRSKPRGNCTVQQKGSNDEAELWVQKTLLTMGGKSERGQGTHTVRRINAM